jgi:dihydrofolate reductase
MMDMKPRRSIAILTFVTLDGVMQAPAQPEEDFSGDFKHGGWAKPYWDEVMAQVKEEAMAEPYDLLLGRRTYEIFKPHFSKASDNDGDAAFLNNAKKYVATSRLKDLDWHNSIPIAGDVAAGVTQLKAQDGPLLQVHGSWQLIQTLLANDLIDEFRLWTFPIVVGPGKRLFGQHPARKDLTLIKTRATPNGALMTIYRRGGTERS